MHAQLPNRSAPDPTATEDEYRDWSDSSSSDSDDPQTVACTFDRFSYTDGPDCLPKTTSYVCADKPLPRGSG